MQKLSRIISGLVTLVVLAGAVYIYYQQTSAQADFDQPSPVASTTSGVEAME